MNTPAMPNSDDNQWPRRTLRALIFSQALIVAAVGLYVVGVFVFFSTFNFGSGGDARAIWVWIAAAALGFIGLCGVVYSVVAAVLTWRTTGSLKWLLIALALPLVESAAVALMWGRM